MTNQSFLDNFYIMYDKVATAQSPGFKPSEIQLIATEAQELLVKTGYSQSSNRLREGFEESEKRTQDFGELVRNQLITPAAYDSALNNDNGVFVSLPNVKFNINSPTTFDVFWLPLSEQVITDIKNCDTGVATKLPVFELKHSQYLTTIKDPFNRPSRKKVLRLRYEGFKHELITDGTYSITSYKIRYLRKPRPIYLDGSLSLSNEVSELSDIKHNEILRLTVELCKRSTYNQVGLELDPKILE